MKAIMRDEQEMKDSGIEWIGNIPNSWHIMKISWLFELIGSGTTPKSTRDEYYNGTINWLQSGDINGGYVNFTEKKISKYICDNNTALTIYAPPFIVIAMYGASIGNISIVNIEACTNQACCVLSCPNEIMNLNYLFYQLKSAKDEMLLSSRGGTQPNISQAIIRQMRVAVPSYKEQQYIANYLDDRCSKIDTIIAEAKSSIEEYKELKQAVIYEAVTKGLDKNVEMKDSGIEWEKKVASGWSYARIKYNYYLKGRIGWQGLKSDEFIDEGPYLVTGTDFQDGKVNWEKCYHITEERYNEAPEIHIQNGDLLITKDGTIGKTAFIDDAPEKASLNSHLLIMRPLNKQYNNRFLYWLINSAVFEKYYLATQTGTIMASLSQEKISNFSFYMPDFETQQLIVNYLDDRCSEIDTIIATKQSLIEDLESYKKSLIYEVVTGKRKVVE